MLGGGKSNSSVSNIELSCCVVVVNFKRETAFEASSFYDCV